MSDLSTPEPIDAPWPEWKGNEARRCTAHKKNGEQCRRHARRGTNVCDFHGAKAPQVKAKARQRLEEAADRMARELLGIATAAESESVRLAAVKDALDRAGLGSRQAVELSARPALPWEEVLRDVAFDGVAQITLAEHRALYGRLPDESSATPAIAEFEIVDVELLLVRDGQDGPVRDGQDGPVQAVNPPADELRALDGVDLSGGDPASPTAPVALPPVSVSYAEAADVMRASRLRTNPIHQKRRDHRGR